MMVAVVPAGGVLAVRPAGKLQAVPASVLVNTAPLVGDPLLRQAGWVITG